LKNGTLIHKPIVQSNIKKLIHDLSNKNYRFSLLPEKIIYMNNGIEYYYVEVEGTDGSKFVINAYGPEAQDLFEEVHKCVICGRPICEKNENSSLITYHPDEKRNLFVEPCCMTLLKKFEIAYGKEFFVP
jgi:hypothetical protein